MSEDLSDDDKQFLGALLEEHVDPDHPSGAVRLDESSKERAAEVREKLTQ
jgi:hypothetical protein